MNGMFVAETTVFLKLNSTRMLFFILGCGIVAVLANCTL